jgi:hypothetical protein
MWCRLIAEGCFSPDSVPTTTSLGTPRIVRVSGATKTVCRTLSISWRVRIKTGRCLSGRAKRKFQISPGSQLLPALCVDERGKFIRLHRMLPVSLLIPFYRGLESPLLEPLARGFTQ